ncbi:putative UPF0613 protein PB24D3.06c [Lepidopterella palustris CBS 459.81]|uniref:Putative UPF0613 protein PB24D3.06c n=1 Tax=Lepidopterella palustris CBS 459.81 TaxID=1314670 RepID=A0A8E2ECA4_9PEZI|nr:putative UPF0613 protein PB24D3.06c [Lepidopterella palustris CBS 459.81]
MAHPGVLHTYGRKLVAFEHTPSTTTLPDDGRINTLLWIGGLGDGLLTVRYPSTLASRLDPEWRLAEVLLSSSYKGWGTGSLKRDATELALCVSYFKQLRPKTKIVLMGHSTGCQDIMHYLVGEGEASSGGRPTIQGAILQAGISDREALVHHLSPAEYDEGVRFAREMVENGRGRDILPNSTAFALFGAPVTATRWLSLASPDKKGEDDYFSSDLDISQLTTTFGSIKKETPFMFLFSEADQHVPDSVDKMALVTKWTDVIRGNGGVVDSRNGGVVPGASHNLEGDRPEVVTDLIERVKRFLARVESSGFADDPARL